MKKSLYNIFITIAIAISALPLMAPGCSDREMNVGYHYITIPGFEEADYIKMLDSGNEEMQYNAICYFMEQNNYDAWLTTDSLKNSPRYDTALLLYQKVYPLMESKNPWISSSAIRYISEFQYNRPVYISYLLNNNNPSLNVQLEIIMDLLFDTIKDQQLLQQKILFLQQQPSWLLKNGAYLLMGKKDNVLPDQLAQAYSNSKEDYKKLLILDVLVNHMSDTAFTFLTREWAVTKNIQIKNTIYSNLFKGSNQQQVMDWFNTHYDLLEKDLARMIEITSEKQYDDISSKLIVLALEKGWKPSSIIQQKGEYEKEYDGEPRLFTSLFLHKYDQSNRDGIRSGYSTAFKRIENALLQYPSLKKEWLAFEKRWFKYPLPEDLVNRHRQLTTTYLQQTALLLQQHKIDSTVYNNFMNDLNREAKTLYQLRTRKLEE